MSLRLKVKEATPPISSDGSEKPNQTLTLSNIYTVAKKSFLSKKALATMVVVLGFYTLFDAIYDGPFRPATSNHQALSEFPSNNDSDSIFDEALRMDLQEYYHERPVKIYLYDLPHR